MNFQDFHEQIHNGKRVIHQLTIDDKVTAKLIVDEITYTKPKLWVAVTYWRKGIILYNKRHTIACDTAYDKFMEFKKELDNDVPVN